MGSPETFCQLFVCILISLYLCATQQQPTAYHVVYGGELLIGASIPLRAFSPTHNTTCGILTLRGLQLMEAFRLALENVNANLSLPFRLGAVMRDDCGSPELAYLNTIYFTAPRISNIFQFAPPLQLLSSSRASALSAPSHASPEALRALFDTVSDMQQDLLARAASNETNPLQLYSKVIGFISGSTSDVSFAVALFLRLFRMPLVQSSSL